MGVVHGHSVPLFEGRVGLGQYIVLPRLLGLRQMDVPRPFPAISILSFLGTSVGYTIRGVMPICGVTMCVGVLQGSSVQFCNLGVFG